MPYRLLGDLLFRHGRDNFVVNEQAVHVQGLEARRIGRLEFDCAAPFRILNARKECRFEQFRFMLEFLHLPPFEAAASPDSLPYAASLPYNQVLA
jgi:hypothetical protein